MARYPLLAGTVVLGLLAAPRAYATDTLPTTNTVTPVTFSFGSGANIWSVQIYSCNETSGGTTVTGDCSNEQVSGVVAANGSLALTYASLSGSHLLGTTVGGANQDLSLDEIVTAPTGETVSSVVLGLTGVTTNGVSDGNEPADVHTSETGVGNPVAINTNMANGSQPVQRRAIPRDPVEFVDHSEGYGGRRQQRHGRGHARPDHSDADVQRARAGVPGSARGGSLWVDRHAPAPRLTQELNAQKRHRSRCGCRTAIRHQGYLIFSM